MAALAGGDYGNGCTAEGADGGGFLVGVAQPLTGKGGLDFEDGVDALGGDVLAGGVREQGRRIEVVEDGNVDLARAAAVAIDDERGGGAVAVGEIAFEEAGPVKLGGGAGGGGVLEEAADGEIGEHLGLDAAEDFGEVEVGGVGCA